jgi:hypothetical protein
LAHVGEKEKILGNDMDLDSGFGRIDLSEMARGAGELAYAARRALVKIDFDIF